MGAPQLKKASVSLPNGKHFIVEANDLSEENLYVQVVELNGKKYDKQTIAHQDIVNGGTLRFYMGSQAKK